MQTRNPSPQNQQAFMASVKKAPKAMLYLMRSEKMP
jgi:hypothetical protein